LLGGLYFYVCNILMVELLAVPQRGVELLGVPQRGVELLAVPQRGVELLAVPQRGVRYVHCVTDQSLCHIRRLCMTM
jgi:hypothetical protein